MRRLWMMYITPRRRAMAKRRPAVATRNSQLKTRRAAARWEGLLTVTAQSQARPSLCSLRPPIKQSREMPELPVPGNEARTIRWNPTTPGLGRGLQVVCGW
jgi:hypothetical protein